MRRQAFKMTSGGNRFLRSVLPLTITGLPRQLNPMLDGDLRGPTR